MMKKIFSKEIFLLPFFILTLFVWVNKVNADTGYTWTDFYSWYDNYSYLSETYSNEIEDLISYYNTNLSSQYSYYIIDFSKNVQAFETGIYRDVIWLYPLSDNLVFNNNSTFSLVKLYNNGFCGNASIYYDSHTDTIYNATTSSACSIPSNTPGRASILSPIYSPYSSNFNLILSDTDYARVTLPSYTNTDLSLDIPEIYLYPTDFVPTYQQTLTGDYFQDYTEIDLNSYDYVILSLKNYSQSPFYTNIYTLGSLCLTSVYNYGMTEKQDYYNNYQTAPCTTTYSNFTPVLVSILQDDLDNYAVYYIKAQSSDTNKIKVDTSVFNISYITTSTISPNVVIGGRSYPVIPFNDLTDTANISSDEGYISGQSCALGDVNCEYETGIGLDISDIFTQPLKVLKDVWTSISTVFTLIGDFITLIPSPLREFLYASFMLAIILGLVKIIIG